MLLLLALIGCNPGSGPTPIDGPQTLTVAPQTGPAPSAPRIETRRPTQALATRAAPAAPPMPTGAAKYTDCGAGPWPAHRRNRSGGIAVEGDAVAPPPPPTKPMNKPRSRPTPTATPVQKSPVGYGGMPDSAAAPSAGSTSKITTGADGGAAAEVGGGTVAGGIVDTRTEGQAAADVPAAPALANNRDSSAVSGPGAAGQPEAEPNDPAPPTEQAMPSGDLVAGRTRGDSSLDQLGYIGGESDKGEAGERERKSGEKAKDNLAKEAKNAEGTEVAARLEDADGEDRALDWKTVEEIDEEEEIPAQNWDYGATVHLSNDDSMSLASAQRVLWSVMNGRVPKVSEIRPHELLNYFSFDTVPVAEDQMFSVMGAAEAQGDTLSVALAVKGATPPRQPLDLTIAVDRSGSMAAEGRMSYTKRGLEQMVDRLHAGDRIDLVTFESRVCTTLEDFVVGRDDPALLRHAMGALYPMGSTDLDGGLQEAYRIQRSRTAAEKHGRNRRVMLITDAMMNTGTVDPNVVSEIGKAFEDDQIRLTGVGVGREFNDDVLDKLTEKGKGAYVYLGSEAVVDRLFGAGFDSLVQTIAHDVRFSIHLPPSLAMARFYGEEASTVASDIQPIHYYAGTSQVFLQDLHIREGGLVPEDPLKLRIEWRDATTGEPDSMELHTTVGALVDGEVRNLHKAQALMAWSDWTLAWAMGDRNACSGPMETYADGVAKINDDAELQFLSDLTAQRCGRPVMAAASVAYKVRLDSDIPIAEVGLQCGQRSWSESMSSGNTVARFAKARPGACTLTLQGTVAMRAPVEVPETGGDVRCTVRGGRLSCS